MKNVALSLLLLVLSFATDTHGHFTGSGHVHTLWEKQRVFLNGNCRATGTCDLKRFALTESVYEVWFSDAPSYPTYGNGVIIEYETASVGALEKYAVVQFKRGCVFYSSQKRPGRIARTVSDTVASFGENVPFCFPHWVIDSQDTDPVYNSDPQYGRFHLLRWNRPGSYDNRTQKYYGLEKPEFPVVYLTDHPAGAFITASDVRNVSLEFNTCIFKAHEVPVATRRDHLNFAEPIACFPWQNVYIYDFDRGIFRTDVAAVPRSLRPSAPVGAYPGGLLALLAIASALVVFWLSRREIRRRGPVRG